MILCLRILCMPTNHQHLLCIFDIFIYFQYVLQIALPIKFASLRLVKFCYRVYMLSDNLTCKITSESRMFIRYAFNKKTKRNTHMIRLKVLPHFIISASSNVMLISFWEHMLILTSDRFNGDITYNRLLRNVCAYEWKLIVRFQITLLLLNIQNLHTFG